MTEPTAQQRSEALQTLEQQVAAMSVQLAEERKRGTGVERVATGVEQWMFQNKQKGPRVDTRGVDW